MECELSFEGKSVESIPRNCFCTSSYYDPVKILLSWSNWY